MGGGSSHVGLESGGIHGVGTRGSRYSRGVGGREGGSHGGGGGSCKDLLTRSTLSHAWQAEGSWGWGSIQGGLGGGKHGEGGAGQGNLNLFMLVAILEAVSKVEMGEREGSEKLARTRMNEFVVRFALETGLFLAREK